MRTGEDVGVAWGYRQHMYKQGSSFGTFGSGTRLYVQAERYIWIGDFLRAASVIIFNSKIGDKISKGMS